MGPGLNDNMHFEDKITIPKLSDDGSNWVDYRDCVLWLLESQTIDDHIDHDSPPTAYQNQGKVGGVEYADRWKKEETAIKQVISPSIPCAAFSRIKGQKNVKGVWDILKQIYEEKTRALAAHLMRRFRNTRCGDNDNVRTHFENLHNLREQLAGMGKLISDEDYTDILLASLPASYDSSCSSISNSACLGSQVLTADVFESLILDEYTRCELKKPLSNSKDEAFGADAPRSKKQCSNCNKRGHLKADCWAKGGGKEGQGPKRNKDKDKSKDTLATAEEVPPLDAWAAIEEIEDGAEEAWVETVAAAGSSLAQPGRTHRTTTEIYNSGAPRHMSPFREQFLNYKPIMPPHAISAANKQVFYAVGTGDLRIEVPDGESSTSILLKDVLHAPEMGLTLVSIDWITKAGYSVTFEASTCKIKRPNGTVIGTILASMNGLYKVEHAYAASIAPEHITLAALHRRLVHIAPDTLCALVLRGAVEGIELINNRAPLICDSCEHGKSTRKVIQKEHQTLLARAFGDEVHTDVWGPSPTLSVGKRKYYITFTDDSTRYTRIDILFTKDEAFDKYKEYAAWAHTQHGVCIKCLRSDRGGEYTSGAFTQFLKEQGTERRLTTHDTPQHNGVAESLNRRLVERVHALLHQSGLPLTLWAEALHFVVWVKNRTLTKALGNVTPFEKLTGRKPNIAGVPEWGQRVWVHTNANNKLGARAELAHWVGYSDESTHAHRIYWAGTNKISTERDVKFTASTNVISITLSSSSTPTAPTLNTPPITLASSVAPTAPAPSTPTQVASTPQQPPATTDSREEEVEVEDELIDTPPPPTSRGWMSKPSQPAQPARQSSRIRKPLQKAASGEGAADGGMQRLLGQHPEFAEHYSALAELIADIDALQEEECDKDKAAFIAEIEDAVAAAVLDAQGDLKSLREAQSCPDWLSWKGAMDREIQSLQQAGTWETVLRPPGKNIVGCKWVYQLKRKADGSVDKHKARLVAWGFSQIYGVDYLDTYSPVAKLASFQTILTLAARFDWEVECFDFNSTYPNGELEDTEEIYMEQPLGYEEGSKDFVKRLRKALYGLKQAGRRWYDTFKRELADLSFRASAADPGVFYTRIRGNVLIIAAHVDDCAMTGNSGRLITVYKAKLNDKFPLTDLGPIHSLLGIEVTHDRAVRTISLSQSTYVDSILSRFSLTDAKSYPTPMVPSAFYSKCDSPSSPSDIARMHKVPYCKAIGSVKAY